MKNPFKGIWRKLFRSKRRSIQFGRTISMDEEIMGLEPKPTSEDLFAILGKIGRKV